MYITCADCGLQRARFTCTDDEPHGRHETKAKDVKAKQSFVHRLQEARSNKSASDRMQQIILSSAELEIRIYIMCM